MKRPILSVAIATLLLSVYCSSDRTQAPEVLNLPPAGEDLLNVSNFADTVLYVPLETTEESLIGNISGLWINDSIMLVSTGNRLLMFSESGKYMHQVGSNGRGPGEYNYIYHFDVIRDTIICIFGRR